jgi:hypothetical protein
MVWSANLAVIALACGSAAQEAATLPPICRHAPPAPPLPPDCNRIMAASATWVVAEVVGVKKQESYEWGVSHGGSSTRSHSWGDSVTKTAKAGFSFFGFGVSASVSGTTSSAIAEATATTFEMVNITTVTYTFKPGVVWQFRFDVRDECGNSTVFVNQPTQTSNIPEPPCCLPGYFLNPNKAHGDCVAGADGIVYDLCNSTRTKSPSPCPCCSAPCSTLLHDVYGSNITWNFTWSINTVASMLSGRIIGWPSSPARWIAVGLNEPGNEPGMIGASAVVCQPGWQNGTVSAYKLADMMFPECDSPEYEDGALSATEVEWPVHEGSYNATMCSFSLSYSAFGLTYPDLARQPIIVALGTSDNWFSGGTGGQSGTGLPGHQGAGNAILDLLSNRP